MSDRSYSMTVVKTLFAHSRNVCAFSDPEGHRPSCEERLTDPAWTQVNGAICHIVASSPKGPRWRAGLTDAERNGYDNLLLLCPNHHRLVDDLLPEQFTEEVLTAMKARHMLANQEPVWQVDDSILGWYALSAIRLTQLLSSSAGMQAPPKPEAQSADAHHLDLPAMSVSHAARVLGLRPARLSSWVRSERFQIDGVPYPTWDRHPSRQQRLYDPKWLVAVAEAIDVRPDFSHVDRL